jgi:two-component system OmpR family response regulator
MSEVNRAIRTLRNVAEKEALLPCCAREWGARSKALKVLQKRPLMRLGPFFFEVERMSERGRILMIDDSEIILATASRRLTREGYEVVTTTQTVGNARHLRTCDLVIVDFHMPGIDGGAVVTSLKEAEVENRAKCPFYLYTSDAGIAAQYARFGFDGAMVNKGDLESLATQVESVFRVIRLRKLQEKRRVAAKE